MLTHEVINDIRKKFGGVCRDRQAKSISEVRASEARPINVRLEEISLHKKEIISPRTYQADLYQRALKENVIIYLGTGLGKTFITVLVLNDPKFDTLIQSGKRVVFLAPTQDLVKQQAEYIASKVPYKVKVYCGRTCNAGLHIDHWKKPEWDSELAKIEILFMTPAILAAALAINVLNWSNFALVIYDEAHHAATSKKERSGKTDGHFYSQTLKHYKVMFHNRDANQPRIIGLTASLINNMPKDVSSIQLGVDDLEKKFYAKCVTDLNANESKPQVNIYGYNSPEINAKNDTITKLFLDYAKRMEEVLQLAKARSILEVGLPTEDQKMVLAYHNRLRLAASGFSIKPRSFHKVLRQLAAIRQNSGIWTLSNICYNLIEALSKHSESKFISHDVKQVYKEFSTILFKILVAINDLVGSDARTMLFEFSQPKLMCLLEALKDEHVRIQKEPSDSKLKFSCIVFVRSRVEVLAICDWLKMVCHCLEEYKFIKADYAIGLSATMASKWSCITKRKSTEQSCMLQNFRNGHLNVIVTTSVLEEGIDLPVCSTVIRYDQADTFRVYVQSRGRARQRDSTFVALSEAEKRHETELRINKYNDFESRVKDILSRPQEQLTQSTTRSGQASIGADGDVFTDEGQGIRITPSTARVILHMYCARLASRSPYADGLTSERRQCDKGTAFQTTLFFPPGCPCKDSVQGEKRRTIEAADNSAIIAAYRALHEAGELDEHGVPIKATEEHIDEILEKHSMRPNLRPLGIHLDGEETTSNAGCKFYSFPWELTRIQTYNLAYKYSSRSYKLFRISFVGDDSVRQDARPYFEQSAFGLIVDSLADHRSWPDKIHSHYGLYKVEYKLIAGDLRLDDQRNHGRYLDFTFNLITNIWGNNFLNKRTFQDKCTFYLVPLTKGDNVDMAKLSNAFYPIPSELRQGDIVKLGYVYQRREDGRRNPSLFLVKSIRTDMNAHSKMPGGYHGESFADRLRNNNQSLLDPYQPVVEICPIARQFGSIQPGKKVRSDHVTQNVFYLRQCLEPIKCDPYIAYQALNLPEIIFRIYLTELPVDLDNRFMNETASDRRDVILRAVRNEADNVLPAHEVEELDTDDSESEEDQVLIQLASGDGSSGIDEDPYSLDSDQFDSDESDASDNFNDYDSDDYDSESSDGPNPSSKYRDILSRQLFNLNERDKSGLEKWDMSEYNVPDLRVLPIKHISFHHYQSYLDSHPGSTTIDLIQQCDDNMAKIEDVLRRFQQGILSDAVLAEDDEILGRPGHVVDLSIETPVKFDRPDKPIRELPRALGLVEALTLRKAGERCNLEALENIGDSYIKYIVSVVLFKYMSHNEGTLTLARSRLVGNKHFTHLAKEKRLGCYAITTKFSPEVLSSVLGSGPPCKNTMRPKDLADMFESFVGSRLVYQGEFEAIMALKWLGMGRIFREDTFAELHENGVAFAKFNTALIEHDNPDAQERLRQCKKRVRRFEDIINYKFTDASYLVQAFTHASAPIRCTDSYERLEFLGDAILDFLVTMTLYNAGFVTDPGQLTFSRSALVNNCTFAKLALKYRYDIFLQHANQELFDELNRIRENEKCTDNLDFLTEPEFDRVTKILGDLFESVAGAIYIDSGCSLDKVYSIYYPMMKELIDQEIANPTKNIVMQLYELFPGRDRVEFTFVRTNTEDGNCLVTAKCKIMGLEPFYGEGRTRDHAKQRAAADAMANLPPEAVKQKLDDDYKRLMEEKRRLARPTRPARGRGQRYPSRGGRGGRGGNSYAPRVNRSSQHRASTSSRYDRR